jgi:hypothetical protein
VISGFRCEVMRNAFFWVIMQRVVVIPDSGQSTGRIFGDQETKKTRLLKMGLIGCPETSVRNCHYLLRNNNPEQCSSQFDNPLNAISLKTEKNT